MSAFQLSQTSATNWPQSILDARPATRPLYSLNGSLKLLPISQLPVHNGAGMGSVAMTGRNRDLRGIMKRWANRSGVLAHRLGTTELNVKMPQPFRMPEPTMNERVQEASGFHPHPDSRHDRVSRG